MLGPGHTKKMVVVAALCALGMKYMKHDFFFFFIFFFYFFIEPYSFTINDLPYKFLETNSTGINDMIYKYNDLNIYQYWYLSMFIHNWSARCQYNVTGWVSMWAYDMLSQ